MYGVWGACLPACLLHTPPLSLPFVSQTMRWIRPDRMSRARHAPYVMDHMYYHGTQHEDMYVVQDTTSKYLDMFVVMYVECINTNITGVGIIWTYAMPCYATHYLYIHASTNNVYYNPNTYNPKIYPKSHLYTK
ncbi:hypothetical protein BO83DRAFT_417163 [Aspergillus eucalypticola CBS 122712]|uniref:Uncharacterized protein n=1 Tax=Aspergillus eucalypticola (strain CBS 122712 / IBT 29274) TaxID=1448314 RepID=A0A317VJI2_ASPEC|nr:uncharacterized protein BO83DRAFT_417163 [Aspergillus eucalypticola CBS 122712]PWY73347.1 hypothetical protein BO83DRAFT_417163 [Aspergillus eucalypticola CBS 122712]